jgi:WD40 repeat protein
VHAAADVTCVALSPDAQTLLTGTTEGTVSIWDARSGAAKGLLLRCGRGILAIEFSPSGEYAAITDQSDNVHLQHVASSLPMANTFPVAAALAARFTPDGSRLVVSFDGPTVGLIRVPAAFAPSADLLLGMTELLLGQRINQQGGWEDLTPEEFFERQQALRAVNWRLGPDPQVHLYR